MSGVTPEEQRELLKIDEVAVNLETEMERFIRNCDEFILGLHEFSHELAGFIAETNEVTGDPLNWRKKHENPVR